MPRRCSYCHNIGHNISNCDSPLIEEKYNIIREKYIEIISRYQSRGKTLFCYFANMNFDAPTIKAVGLKYIGITTSHSKRVMIEKLWEHFNSPTEEDVDMLARVPDEVPSYAQDLITWTIDRTPDTNIDNSSPEAGLDFTTWIRRNNYVLRRYLYLEALSFLEDEFIPLEPRNIATTRKYDIQMHLETSCIKEEQEEECGICFELTKEHEKVQLDCGHKFCGQCIKGCLKVGSITCAMCRHQIKNINVKTQETYDLVKIYCNE